MDPVAPKHLGADLISPDSPDLLPLSRLLTLPTGSLFLLRCGELPLQGSEWPYTEALKKTLFHLG